MQVGRTKFDPKDKEVASSTVVISILDRGLVWKWHPWLLCLKQRYKQAKAITGRGRYVVYEQAHLRTAPAFFELCFNSTTYFTSLRKPRPSVEVIEKCKSKLTHLSLVWKTAGGVAKPFFNETTASHAEAGGHQDSGSQLAKPAGPGEEPLETVG